MSVSAYNPILLVAADGHVTVDWRTPDGQPPTDGGILVLPEVIVDYVNTRNALVDLEHMVNMR